ncbi:MAG TPA: hypothetical protein VLA50_06885 [Erythrobacter sp.]|nr:hypothetical protein [Erythrobacter sp.]
MATLPPETILARDHAASAGGTSSAALAQAWARLQGQAGQLAMLARLAAETEHQAAAIEPLLGRAEPWQRTLAEQTMADIDAMLASGLTALATLSRRGQDTAAPALVLWREFHAARTGLLTVLETPGAA